jgi:hypothetical protein
MRFTNASPLFGRGKSSRNRGKSIILQEPTRRATTPTSNYRGITMLPTSYNAVTCILLSKLLGITNAGSEVGD